LNIVVTFALLSAGIGMGYPSATPSVPLRSTQGFDSGLRLRACPERSEGAGSGIPCAALLADVGWRSAFPSPASSAAQRSGWKIDCLNDGHQ
jgi:hypothetical protein